MIILSQERAAQLKAALPHAHHTTAVDVIADMKLSGPKGRVDEPRIVEAIAHDRGWPFTRLEALELDPDFVTRVLHQKFADRFLLVPISETKGKLRLAVFDPLATEVLDDVCRVTGKMRDDLEIVVAPRTDLRKIILEFHGFRSSIKAADKKFVKHFKEVGDSERLAEVKSLEEIAEGHASDRNIRTAVDAMFRRAVSQRASDIHGTTQASQKRHPNAHRRYPPPGGPSARAPSSGVRFPDQGRLSYGHRRKATPTGRKNKAEARERGRSQGFHSAHILW